MSKFILWIIVIFMTQSLAADSLEESISKLTGFAAKEYVNPVISPLGVAMNTGWFRRPPIAEKWNLNFQFSVSAVGAFFSTKDKQFEASGSFTFSRSEAETFTEFMEGTPDEFYRDYLIDALSDPESGGFVTLTGPTIIGSSSQEIEISSITYLDPTSNEHEQYDLLGEDRIGLGATGILEDYPIFPMAAPQLTLGTLYGTTASFRFLPFTYIDDELGKFSYFGFGLQHNPKVWFDYDFPTDVSLSFSTQTISIGSVLESRASSFGVHISETYGWSFLNFTPYAGYLIESSQTDVSYTFIIDHDGHDSEEINVKFSSKGENKSRFLVGLATRIGIFDMNFDINLGKYSAFNLTAGLGTTIKF